MTRKFALILSVLFHPLLMPTAGMIILLYSGSYFSNFSPSAKRMLILLFSSGTMIMPALMIALIYMRGMTGDLQLTDQKDRTTPLAITLIFYILTFFIYLRIPVYRFMHSFMLASVLSVLVSLLINFRWKVSLHMVGLGGILAFILIISIFQHINLLPYLILTIFITGLTASSRLYLYAHSPGQVYSGLLIGFIIMAGCLSLY